MNFTLYFHSFLLVMFMNVIVMMNGEGEKLNRQRQIDKWMNGWTDRQTEADREDLMQERWSGF